MKEEKYNVTGMTCAACQANVTKAVQKVEGVENVNVNLLSNQMTVKYDEAKTGDDLIISAVENIGYGASLMSASKGEKGGFRSQWEERQNNAESNRKAMKKRLIASICMLIPLMYIAMAGMLGLPTFPFFKGEENMLILALTQMLIAIPIMIINRKFYTSGYKALFKRSPNMDSLVAIGSSAAFIYGVIAIYCMAYGYSHMDMEPVMKFGHSLYFESAAMIVTLVTIGKYLEAKSKAKTSDALGRLIDLAPKTANVIRNEKELTIPAEQVQSGDIVVIRPGESLPVDGTIIEGYGYLDQSAITGESIPVEKLAGDSVISATTNKNGTFKFKASKVGEDTTLSQIIRLVDEAGNTKAPIARVADKVSGIFVPIVIGIAIITAIIWIVFGSGDDKISFALTNAISVLVISCPCALGLATPVAIMVGTGKAAELGILIKSAVSLENLHNIDTIVLDKTGTITEGHPAVTDIIVAPGISEKELLTLAAMAEKGSEHPLAQAIMEKAEAAGIEISDADSFEAVSGRGIKAAKGENNILAGNRAFIEESGLAFDKEKELNELASKGKTPLIFYKNNKFIGIIAVADVVREASKKAIEEFKNKGISVVMLTGDNKITAEAIKNELGIEKVISDVLPADKDAVIQSLQAEGKKVAMVGDGINDAPALSRADIGIAIGAGTDIALDSADVVLMKSSLYDVVTAIELSNAVVKNIRMNLFWAFFYNALGIPVAAGALYPAFGIGLSPMIGSAAMSISSVCVVTNALRLRFFKAKNAEENNEEKINIQEGNEMKKILKVDGMMCNHCRAHVEKALSAVDGVSKVEVSLEDKQAEITIEKDVADDALKAAVKDAGYQPGKII